MPLSGGILRSDESYATTQTVGIDAPLTIKYAMGEVKKMHVHAIGINLDETGNAASYAAIFWTDGTNVIELARTTGTAPDLFLNVEAIDTGYDSDGKFYARTYNAGGATHEMHVVFIMEKVE